MSLATHQPAGTVGRGLFDITHIVVDHHPLRAARITCGACGVSEQTRNNGVQGRASSNTDETEFKLLSRKFENQGWQVGRRRQEHRCPTCAPNRKEPVTMASAKVVDMPTPPASQQPPRTMGREDRRLIFAKLEEVYADEKTGYRPGWSDKKVGEDMAVPQAWVATIRDENFGPHGSNPDIDNAITRGNEVVTECRALAKKLIDAAEAVERRLIDLAQTVRP